MIRMYTYYIYVMKKLAWMSLLVFVFGSMSVHAQETVQQKKKDKKTEQLVCWVSMDCENCKSKIEKNIAYEKGVKDMKVDLDTKLVTITYRSDKTTPEKLEKAIQDLGFKTEVIPAKKEGEEKKQSK